MAGFDDFDFLIGEWTVTNERLKARFAGCTEWEIFEATSKAEKVMPIPASQGGGFGGNLDQMFIPARGFTGMTLRLYDPATRAWSIYWSDTKTHRLFPPTVGRFEDGRGLFYGDDVEGGVPVKVRFVWTPGEAPVWEQAMSTDGGAPSPPDTPGKPDGPVRGTPPTVDAGAVPRIGPGGASGAGSASGLGPVRLEMLLNERWAVWVPVMAGPRSPLP